MTAARGTVSYRRRRELVEAVEKWWFPWLFPVMLLGDVTLVSRPALFVVWMALCLGASRLINGALEKRAHRRRWPH